MALSPVQEIGLDLLLNGHSWVGNVFTVAPQRATDHQRRDNFSYQSGSRRETA
jgi:hypothetical protein